MLCCEVAIHDHSDNSITIGHVADSTAALGSKHGDGWNGVALTRDHKPNLKASLMSLMELKGLGGFRYYMVLPCFAFLDLFDSVCMQNRIRSEETQHDLGTIPLGNPK